MLARLRAFLFVAVSISVGVACGDFDRDVASLQIRERFCDRWPYGCDEATDIRVVDVETIDRGRLAHFKIVAGSDSTGVQSGAYFEREGERWELFTFEGPFVDRLRQAIARVEGEQDAITDRLQDLQSSQAWHRSIYGRYGLDFEELRRVSYRSPDLPIEMSVEGEGQAWTARARGERVECRHASDRYRPTCQVLGAGSGGEPRPLAATFAAPPTE